MDSWNCWDSLRGHLEGQERMGIGKQDRTRKQSK